MGDDVPPTVEFLDGAADAGGEEVLAAPAPNPLRTTLILFAAGLLLVAAVGAVIARGNRGEQGRARAAVPPTAPAVSGPVPVTGSEREEGASPLADCPADARCSLWVHAPAATLAALRAAFPGAVLRTASTVLANRTGHFEPDLVRRVLVAADGSRIIRIGIRTGAESESAAGRDRPAMGPRTRVSAQRSGYRICVAVSGPGAGEVSARATRLAADARLLATL